MGKSVRSPGEISDSRRAWVTGPLAEAIFYAYPEDEEDDRREVGQEVALLLKKSGERSTEVRLALTQMTEAELVAMHRVIEIAFANALETVKFRDELAVQMLASGETGMSRMFRSDPRVIVREGEDYKIEPKFLKREWTGGAGASLEFNPTAVPQEKVISSRNPDED